MTKNLMLSRDLTVIEKNLLGDIAEQVQESCEVELPHNHETTIYELLEKAALAGYLWGLRTGFSAGYTDAVAALNNPDFTKPQAMAEFLAATHDAAFVDQKVPGAVDAALVAFFSPTRLDLHV